MRAWMQRFGIVRDLRYRRKRAGLLRAMTAALSRGAATAARRTIDPTDPTSWEFCAFSQNNEDGILDYLTGRLREPNRAFVEIGAGDGRENNTTWLAVARRYMGTMVDADPLRVHLARRLLREFTNCVEFRCLRVTPENVAELFLCRDPDVFSIDIDGAEQPIVAAVFAAGLRPAIVVTEFDFHPGPGPLDVWREFMEGHGYRFVTVDSNAVNAFFVDPERFEREFLAALKESGYRDSAFRRAWYAREERGSGA